METTARRATLWLVLLLAGCNAFAQPGTTHPKFDKRAIDSYLDAEMKKGQIPGLAYAILQDGKMIDHGDYGVSNVELQSPVHSYTKFNLGSIGKTFTATAIMLLVKDGKLFLDDPIAQYLDSLPETWKTITIRHLLSHTSGIVDYVDDFPGYPVITRRDRKQNYTAAEFIQMATELPLNFAPGERYAYSNSNFVLLGFIIQNISGKSLPAFMEERVFAPLGMDETVYMTQTAIIPNRAHGYLLDEDNTLINGNYISDFFSSTGDMGVTTTISDMAKWNMAIDNGIILDTETLNEMWTPTILNNGGVTDFAGVSYGLGWMINVYRGYRKIGHTGSFKNGYTANYFRYDDFKLAVIMLTNLNPTDLNRMSCNLAGFYIPALAGIEHIQPSSTADIGVVESVNRLMEQIHNDNLDTTQVTSEFKKRMNPITKFMPPLGSMQYVASDVDPHRKLYRFGYPIEKIHYFKQASVKEDDAFYLTLYMTPDNRIAGWSIY